MRMSRDFVKFADGNQGGHHRRRSLACRESGQPKQWRPSEALTKVQWPDRLCGSNFGSQRSQRTCRPTVAQWSSTDNPCRESPQRMDAVMDFGVHQKIGRGWTERSEGPPGVRSYLTPASATLNKSTIVHQRTRRESSQRPLCDIGSLEERTLPCSKNDGERLGFCNLHHHVHSH